MIFAVGHIFRRMMSTSPASRFLTLPNSPIVLENGDIDSSSINVHYWEWQGHKPAVLFCHAASFHGRCYDRLITEALRGYHVIAIDFRGHGQSVKHPPPYQFRWFGEDLFKIIHALGLTDGKLIGIGHSVGGYALTWAAAKASTRLFHSLLLLDPVIFPPSFYQFSFGENVNTEQIARRKSQFTSIEDMISRMSTRGPFAQWPKDVLRDYCTHALDENFALQCAPVGEASIYQYGAHADNNIYPLIEKSAFINDIPIDVVRASLPFISGSLNESPTSPELATCFKKGRDILLKDARHLFPMENPQLAIETIRNFLKEHRTLYANL